jgi:hypothetical protein
MENPLEVLNSVGDGATGAVRSVGTGLTGIISNINATITNALDKPPILGKYGPHKAIDRLVRGTVGAIDTGGNGAVSSVQNEGHAIVNTLKTPFDQLSEVSGGMKGRR